jgi:hypothetical protein
LNVLQRVHHIFPLDYLASGVEPKDLWLVLSYHCPSDFTNYLMVYPATTSVCY